LPALFSRYSLKTTARAVSLVCFSLEVTAKAVSLRYFLSNESHGGLLPLSHWLVGIRFSWRMILVSRIVSVIAAESQFLVAVDLPPCHIMASSIVLVVDDFCRCVTGSFPCGGAIIATESLSQVFSLKLPRTFSRFVLVVDLLLPPCHRPASAIILVVERLLPLCQQVSARVILEK